MKRLTQITTAVLVAILVAAPLYAAARGSGNLSKFVAIGDSYGAGVVSGSLNERHQPWSWPAVIAKQAGHKLCAATATANDACWAQPLVSFPGLGPELQLVNLTPTITPAAGAGTPLMTTFGRSYNNLAIPGATVGAVLSLTGAEPPTAGEPTAVSMARFILRGRGTAVAQALGQNPTFIAVWIGGNDALSTMFSGSPTTLTPTTDFKVRYEALLDALIAGAPSAGIVVGNIPVKPLPYMLLIPPFITNPANGQPFYFIADLGGGNIGQLPQGSYVLLHAKDKLASGYGLPGVPPFTAYPNAGKPLADSDVITPAEFQQIAARIVEYNAVIAQAAGARNIPVANIAGLFDRVYAGARIGGFTISAAPVTGGFFGFDFFHLTDLGYLLFANEYIRTINASYDAGIPVASIAQLWVNNGAFFPESSAGVSSASDVIISSEAIEQIRAMWAQPTIRRLRAVGH